MTLIQALAEIIEMSEEHLSNYGFIVDYSEGKPPPEYIAALEIVKAFVIGQGEEKPVGFLKLDDYPTPTSPRH